jgi:hypothetical protein
MGSDVMAGHQRPSPGRRQQPAQHAHRGRLARAVRLQEAVDLAGRDPQVDLIDRADLAEVTDQCLGADRVAGVHRPPGSGRAI